MRLISSWAKGLQFYNQRKIGEGKKTTSFSSFFFYKVDVMPPSSAPPPG